MMIKKSLPYAHIITIIVSKNNSFIKPKSHDFILIIEFEWGPRKWLLVVELSEREVLKLPNHSPSMTIHRKFLLYSNSVKRKRGINVSMSSIKILRNLHSSTSSHTFFLWFLEQKIRRNFSFNWELFDSTTAADLSRK